MTARSVGAPSITIDVDAAADDNGKNCSCSPSTAACASSARACLNTHGARFWSTGLTLVRYLVAVQCSAA